jgi:hypothetical protein
MVLIVGLPLIFFECFGNDCLRNFTFVLKVRGFFLGSFDLDAKMA